MYGSDRLGPLVVCRDSWLHRVGDDYGARELLTKEQHAGGKAAGNERTESGH